MPGYKERIIREVNFAVILLVFALFPLFSRNPVPINSQLFTIPGYLRDLESLPMRAASPNTKHSQKPSPSNGTCLQQFAFKYEIAMKSPGGNIFCSSSCSTDTGIQKHKPNRLTIPHNIISATCNLFSMIIRYLERET